MKNLLDGILEFRATQLSEQKELFAKLALGQKPDALFIACSDSRVVPNVFASTKPGELLVQRCVGNMVPSCKDDGDDHHCMGHSEGAAIEFSIINLKIRDIIVCGHSECGAMIAIIQKYGLTLNEHGSYYTNMIHYKPSNLSPHLDAWLSNGVKSIELFKSLTQEELNERYPTSTEFEIQNRVSQINVQIQMENLLSYPTVKEAVMNGTVRLHAWYFDIASCQVYALLPSEKKWAVIDEDVAPKIMNDLKENKHLGN